MRRDVPMDDRPPTRVLAVDDDDAVLGLLARVLSSEGMKVSCASTAAEALEAIREDPPDIVLLDVMLADKDGFEVLAELRRTNDVPVILLTGRTEEPDRVFGLRIGADDYVTKPFSYPELVARVHNIIRRTGPKATGSVRTFGNLTINLTSREVRVDDRLVEVTAREYDLLAFLSGSPRQVFSRDQLLHHVWESSSEWQDEATVTEHVRRVRLKIEAEPDRPRYIVTVRGAGYRFEP